MDFLKAEIERKRKLMEEAKVLKSSGPAANKYFKRGELLKKQVRKIMLSYSSHTKFIYENNLIHYLNHAIP